MADVLQQVLTVLPPKVAREVERIGTSQHRMKERLSEIRLRAGGLCTLVLSGRNIPLHTAVDEKEVAYTAERVCGGAMYAYRDTIAQGYIPMPQGVRVGICGRARYDGGVMVGVSDIRSLVFRMPSAPCEIEEQLMQIWQTSVSAGMLIYAPPGGGKTTALRALARRIGTEGGQRVCVIDEREEFFPEDYTSASVDLLRGYRRAEGIEIAVRTLTPQVLVVDEIGGEEEARAMASVVSCGIPVLASAHAADAQEVMRKSNLAPFFACGLFDVLVGIRRTPNGYAADVKRCL